MSYADKVGDDNTEDINSGFDFDFLLFDSNTNDIAQNDSTKNVNSTGLTN